MKRSTSIILAILVILIALRIALPYALLHYATYRINQIPEYQVKIADVDVNLLAGNYIIKHIELKKIAKNIPEPFFKANTVDLSVDWPALLHGGFVAKIIVNEPNINFVIDPKGNNEQLSINQEWQNAVKALFPLNINALKFNRGQLHFRSFSAKPPFDLYLKNIDFSMTNMQEVENKAGKFSSNFHATANTMDGGDVKLKGDFNPFSKQPEFYFTLGLHNMQMKAANNFLRHYTKVDLEQGLFSLFIELAAANGKITGYAKPIMKDLKIARPKNEGPIEALYKGAIELVQGILTNSKKDTVATKIPIQGKVDDPNVSILATIGSAISHAFIEALLPQIDHDIKPQKVLKPR